MFRLSLLVLTSVALAIAQKQCPDVEVLENFEAQEYLGKWYEQEKIFFAMEAFGKCITANYSLNDNGTIKVFNEQINKHTNESETIEGIATLDSKTEAKLIVNFPKSPVMVNAPYWILGTDYKTYSIVWSCIRVERFSLRYLWLLTRERNPADDVIRKMYSILDNQDIARDHLIKTDQKNCP